MSREIPRVLRRIVIQRAGNRCEYCGLAQAGQEATFHIDHVVPVTTGGQTRADNLALACVSCSLRKGARSAIQDPQSGDEADLFNPREENWQDHFEWDGAYVLGKSPTGRGTVEALKMNRPMIVAIRLEEAILGRHPPQEG